MGVPTKITNHAAQALGRLLEQYRDKPLIAAVLNVLNRQTQALEDVFWDLFTDRRFDTAEGAQLDVLGAIVGEPRGSSTDDAEYRVRVRARAQANKSQGTTNDVIAVFDILFEDTAYDYEIVYGWPAGFTLRVLDPITNGLEMLYAKFLGDVKPIAVRAIFEWQGYDDADMFCFEGGPGLGWDDGTGTVGGRWAGAVAPPPP